MKQKNIEKALSAVLPSERIKTRYIDIVSYAADAGFYYLLPLAVVRPVSEEEIVALFRFSHDQRIPLVFRAGGTSLSGQSITDGILIDLSQYWNKLSIQEEGGLVRVQPGITGAMVNAYLRKYRRKIGPDPSSITAAMMGGILSNNSSGMCCGVTLNSYHTTRYIRFILPGGNTFSTEHQSDYTRFESECPEVFAELAQLRGEIISNPLLYERIRKKYTTKNTVGYSLNAFIDYEHPLDILAHLLIGAEGTLAFIAEAVMDTVPDFEYKSTALLYFPDIYAACQAIVPLKRAGAEAVELMDRASLRSVEDFPGMPAQVKELPATAAALLIEFQDNDLAGLQHKVNSFLAASGTLSLYSAPVFTSDPDEQAFLWKVRKGMFPAVGAVRQSGTTVILEDVAFPVEKLGDAIIDLQQLFVQFGYDNAIIFGHAKDGNIHFVVTQSFNEESEVSRYDRFLRAVVELVVNKYDGTLKAEHGTGRNIAPFVETEWGPEAYQIMKRLKECIDPENLLNPGVIINDDPALHIRDLKELPSVEEEVDRCIECGYCEHRCPSRDLTLTPRRRIVVRRELKKLQQSGDKAAHRELLEQYQYDGLQTCAVDGLCATACPVYINTGDLVKRLRRENHSASANRLALWVARNFGLIESAARIGLYVGNFFNSILGKRFMPRLTAAIRSIIPAFPLWSEQLGAPPSRPRTLPAAPGAGVAPVNETVPAATEATSAIEVTQVSKTTAVPEAVPGDKAAGTIETTPASKTTAVPKAVPGDKAAGTIETTPASHTAPVIGTSHRSNEPENLVIYFPACISRLMGRGVGKKKNIMETFISVSRKAGISVVIPGDIHGSCCGQIFSSKGFSSAYAHTVNNIVERLWSQSAEGRWPVVIDVSSCAYTLRHIRHALSDENKQRYDRIRILDSVEYLHDMVLPRQLAVSKKGNIVLHPVCSLEKMGTQQKFVAVAHRFAEQVTVPKHAGCCGMAGDRGFLFPELTNSATYQEATEVRESTYEGYYSSTKTCEMAMSEAVQANYESILYLADESMN